MRNLFGRWGAVDEVAVAGGLYLAIDRDEVERGRQRGIRASPSDRTTETTSSLTLRVGMRLRHLLIPRRKFRSHMWPCWATLATKPWKTPLASE